MEMIIQNYHYVICDISSLTKVNFDSKSTTHHHHRYMPWRRKTYHRVVVCRFYLFCCETWRPRDLLKAHLCNAPSRSSGRADDNRVTCAAFENTIDHPAAIWLRRRQTTRKQWIERKCGVKYGIVPIKKNIKIFM